MTNHVTLCYCTVGKAFFLFSPFETLLFLIVYKVAISDSTFTSRIKSYRLLGPTPYYSSVIQLQMSTTACTITNRLPSSVPKSMPTGLKWTAFAMYFQDTIEAKACEDILIALLFASFSVHLLNLKKSLHSPSESKRTILQRPSLSLYP